MKPITLVCDGMNLVHRGFYASYGFGKDKKDPTLLSDDEFKSIAVRGLTNIILADIKRVEATHCAVVFDRPGKTFRHRIYPEYKANRAELSGIDMRRMVLPAKNFLNLLGIKVFGKKCVEGDDLIGSIAVRASKHGKVYISSNDKDFASLVNKRIFLLKPKGEVLDADGVFETYGVEPKQMVDYLMMLGDSIDNVPGINKVGPVTASKLLAKHGTLKAVCSKEKFTAKMRVNFDQAEPMFDVTRKLITIDTTHYQDLDIDSLKLSGLKPGLKQACAEFGYKSLYTTIINTLG
jgi:DNA polymerase-1